MPIKRYFSSTGDIANIQHDFKFLLKFIYNSGGEYDFALRENYFNIYYRGNSLAKVQPMKNGLYKATIHNEFFLNSSANNSAYFKDAKSKKDYSEITLCVEHLHPFFQVKNMNDISSRIKKRGYGEEIYFEQTLITDNLNRKKYIIIDRQVTDTSLRRRRMDLLILKHLQDEHYQFLVAEVKMGNNKELKREVSKQLDNYVKHIGIHFDAYRECYEKQYEQKKALGLMKHPDFPSIQISLPVEGIIIIGGYSGIADGYIDELNKTNNPYPIRKFKNEL